MHDRQKALLYDMMLDSSKKEKRESFSGVIYMLDRLSCTEVPLLFYVQ